MCNLNLDTEKEENTHWTYWSKKGRKCCYFDSYGLMPPNEFEAYIKSNLFISTYQIQGENDICGQLCLVVLYKLLVLQDFIDVLMELFLIKCQ